MASYRCSFKINNINNHVFKTTFFDKHRFSGINIPIGGALDFHTSFDMGFSFVVSNNVYLRMLQYADIPIGVFDNIISCLEVLFLNQNSNIGNFNLSINNLSDITKCLIDNKLTWSANNILEHETLRSDGINTPLKFDSKFGLADWPAAFSNMPLGFFKYENVLDTHLLLNGYSSLFVYDIKIDYIINETIKSDCFLNKLFDFDTDCILYENTEINISAGSFNSNMSATVHNVTHLGDLDPNTLSNYDNKALIDLEREVISE